MFPDGSVLPGVLWCAAAAALAAYTALFLLTARPVSLRPRRLGYLALGVAALRLVLLLFGILAGISGAFWTSGKLWIWAALVVLVGIVVGMYLVALPFFNNVRHAVGLATFDDVRKGLQPPEPVSASDLETLLASSAPMTTALIGVGGLAIITWLMVLKPF